jgi:hypothetical protein
VPGLIDMNLTCAGLRLAIVAAPPPPIVQPANEEPPKAANDNEATWPLIPFPSGWCASN